MTREQRFCCVVFFSFSLSRSLCLCIQHWPLNIVHIRTSSEFIRIIHMNSDRWYATTKVLNVFNTHHSSNYHICTFTIAFTIRQRENVFWNIFTSSRSLFECVCIYICIHCEWIFEPFSIPSSISNKIKHSHCSNVQPSFATRIRRLHREIVYSNAHTHTGLKEMRKKT